MTTIKLLLISCVIYSSVCDDLVVTVKDGQIRGRVQTMLNGKRYYAWQGIPYAAPPIGNLRFQAPTKPASWKGIRNTTKDSSCCYQVKTDPSVQKEDCLYLNVFAPPKKGSTKLPVIFWIYGGAFRVGCANFYSFGPDRFIDEDVIVVTHNYRNLKWTCTVQMYFNDISRLGPFGFLSTGDTVVPGNAGLKDQSLALRWTYKNIAAFGGDPRKIVIVGESAGSASVGYQLLSPLNKGLFRGAIQQSGSPLNEWAFMAYPKPYVASLIQQINPHASIGDNSQKQLEFLQQATASAIHAASQRTTPALALPVVEPQHDGAFITEKMYESFASGNFNRVPVVIGCNSEEDIFLVQSHTYVRKLGEGLDANPHYLLPGNLVTDENRKRALENQIKNIYIPSDRLFAQNEGAVIRFNSDNGFTRGVIKQAELMSYYANIYFYIFSYDGELGGWNKSVEGAEKVTHGEDIYYLWVRRSTHSNEDLTKLPASDRITSERMVNMWANFAKNLNPTPAKSSLLQNVSWPRVDASNYRFLDIDTDLRVKTTPKASYPLWKTAYESYSSRPYVTF